ncbi:MAG: hypothetical protein KC613_27395, partial [Myxococcales bacterium]|nr:hypothetical protein [Myxococcales bacterium]
VDLDGDGLSQTEEVALGTSDVDVDSDDDGAFDHVERWAGRDPTAADPPSLTVPVLQVPSDLLIQAPEPERARSRTGRSYAPDSPYCEYEGERGRCHDPAGRILVEWVSDTVADTPIVAADGSYVLFTTFDGVYQLPFATGTPELWISAADLHARIGEDITGGPESGFAAYQTWVPVDRQTLFVGTAFDRFSRERKGRFPRYERLDGAPGGPVTFTTLFDTEVDFCDAGLTRCTPETYDPLFDGLQWGPGTADPYERSPFWTVAMGYHHELQRFLVGVGGHQQSLLLGFHRDPDEPPARLSRARGLYPLDRQRYLGDAEFDWCVPFPGTVQAVKPGLYQVGEWRWRGPALEPVPVASRSGPSKALACDRGETLPYIAPWGSPSAFGHLMTGRGLTVLTPQRLNRGDTLLLGALSSLATGLEAEAMPDARMLYALGPWVGQRPLWDAPDPDLVRGTGLAVADDLRVCVADRAGQQVLEFLPEPGTDRPTVKGRRVTGVDAIACLWRGDELLVLTGDAVLAVDEGGGLREVQAHGAAQPVAFALDAEGALQVLDRGQAGAPAGWIRRQDGA